MKRLTIEPRPGWQSRAESVGLTFHTPGGQRYWDESAAYELTAQEVDLLEAAANNTYELCIKAAEHIVESELWAELGIPPEIGPFIRNSWERDDFSLYGRFDFAWVPGSPPKLLEFNADTPTALVEAAVAQWYWLEEKFPGADQFNSIHEKLIRGWRKLAEKTGLVYLGGLRGHEEDEQTVAYLQDTCHQAGIETRPLFIDDLGFHKMRRRFVDLNGEEVGAYFKLFPWEWMWHSEFGEQLELEVCQFIEPMWKMALSNKALLPILWKLFPDHPNLLPATFKPGELHDRLGIRDYVQKPKLSREGANIAIVQGGAISAETTGEYGEEGFIYQALAPTAVKDGNHAIFGLWIVDHEACGLGIREDKSPITGNFSRFVPHFFKP